MILLIIVNNDLLKMPINDRYIVNGSKNFIKFQFDFLYDVIVNNILVLFEQNGNKYELPLDANNQVELPKDIIDGELFISLKNKDNNLIITKNKLKIRVDKNITIFNK